jgi:hypothetical protein
VLATVGGAFMNPETREAIAEAGVSVWLRAELPLLLRRVGKRKPPLLKTAILRSCYKTSLNHTIYAHADITVRADVPGTSSGGSTQLHSFLAAPPGVSPCAFRPQWPHAGVRTVMCH